MNLFKVVAVVAITAAINAAWGSDFCPSLPAMNCSCPSGWQLWRKACYRLTESKADWESSKSACQNLGGMMAAPHSLEEMKFMADLARQNNSNYIVWIACSDNEVEGNWTCDGQEGSKPFMEWQPRQPDNYRGNQDCAVIAARHGDSMDDGRCSESHDAVCICQAACTPRQTQPRRYCFSTDTHGRILNSTCLLDHVIRNLVTDSITACGSACAKEPRCHSFNIKKNGDGKKLCQLNNSTSSEDKDKFQTIGDFCIYSENCMD
ncbi:type-2 ice-structuring protein-like [Acanthaster planci]|uniref:Type-2 ice-structuring protein-like n=1 Tax=Acanthaster planci TaxID=133434 RepID=A0A8B7Y969_ACAPL|nr:type-2 ice-structuring protein-like [Acanthaster planci]